MIYDEGHYLGDKQRGNAWEYSIINSVPNGVQTLLLSATIGNYDKIFDWLNYLNIEKETEIVVVDPKMRPVPLVWKTYDKVGGFQDVILGTIDSDFELDEKKKRAFELIYKAQNQKTDDYEMTEEDYQQTYLDFKNKLFSDCDAYDENSLRARLKEAYSFLDKDQVEFVVQFMMNDDDKRIRKLKYERQDYSSESFDKSGFIDLTNQLRKNNMLPAIIFRLAQGGCEDAMDELKDASVLTTKEEQEQILEIVKKYQNNNTYLGSKFAIPSTSDDILEQGRRQDLLCKGYAIHHAGRMPGYKKMVEELFAKKLVKVVVSTSTLGVGINMPAKTVVFNSLTYSQYNPETDELQRIPVSVNEFYQMAGRAGRRGIDTVGNVVLFNLRAFYNKTKDEDNADIVDVRNKKGKSKKVKSEPKEEYTYTMMDEYKLASKLLSKSAGNIKSHFRPEPVSLAQYYSEHTNNDDLADFIGRSFKAFSAYDSYSETQKLMKKFENYSRVLLKQGFIRKDGANKISLTPKGEILTMSQGTNPLMIASLLYDEKLKNVTPQELCQIIGYLSGSDVQKEMPEEEDIVKEKIKYFIRSECIKDSTENEDGKFSSRFFTVRSMFGNKESKILKSLKEERVDSFDIKYSDSFSGFVTYAWANLNKMHKDTVGNFYDLMLRYLNPAVTDNDRANSSFNRKATDGNVYKIITQSISTLKQIDRICNYAIEREDIYPNTSYWQDLKQTTQEAIELMKREPINDEIE